MCLKEFVHGKMSPMIFLRVFSYKAFIHVSRDERSKLDNKTKQCLFIEYEHEEFGVDFGTRSTTK